MSETKPEEGNQDQKPAKQKETHRKAKAPMVPWPRLSRSLSTDSLSTLTIPQPSLSADWSSSSKQVCMDT